MTVILSMLIGAVIGAFVTIIVMMLMADRDDNEP